MSDGEGYPDEWARWLWRMTHRPGWSVAKLARESGIARQTIFGWIKEGGATLNLASVRTVAAALDADLATAMLAAADLLPPPSPQDEEIQAILESNLTEEKKHALIAVVRARRARDLELTQQMVDIARAEST